MEAILTTAAKVSTGWSLAAFAIAILFFFLTRKVEFRVAVVGAVVVLLLGALPIIADTYLKAHPGDLVYHLRVTVLDPLGNPVDNANVTSDRGGEPKAVAGGWQFDIPASTRGDGRVTVYAQVPTAFWRGNASVVLTDDFDPIATIHLGADQSGSVRGQVVDGRNRAIANVSVSAAGKAPTTTNAQGEFTLSGFPEGSSVRLHFETDKGLAMDQDLWAGTPGQSVRFIPTPATG